MPRPESTEYASFYASYIALVPEDDILPAMASQLDEMLALLRSVSEAEAMVRHAPYTWSTKEVVGHLIDGERIFSYRALRFAREDATPLPSFDENPYAKSGAFDRLPLTALVEEFDVVRRASLCLFRNLPADAWTRRGIASNAEITVNAVAYIVVGHVRHHGGILRKRLGRA